VCSPLPCMLVCRHSCALWHMRPRVQRAPGIPCALFSKRGTTSLQNLGQIMPRDRGRILSSHVVPDKRASGADPGSIRRGGNCESKMADGFASTTTAGGYGSLRAAFAKAWAALAPSSTAKLWRRRLAGTTMGRPLKPLISPDKPVTCITEGLSRPAILLYLQGIVSPGAG
jgi:hypothetical protein